MWDPLEGTAAAQLQLLLNRHTMAKWPDQVFPLFKRGHMSGLLCGISSILNVSNSEMSYGSTTAYLRLKQALTCLFAVCFKLSSYLATCVRREPLRAPKTDCGQ